MHLFKVLFLASLCFNLQAKPRKWNEKMQGLGKTFTELLPELSESSPITPNSQKKLEQGTKKLLELAHSINDKARVAMPEADPTIPFVSNLFERKLKNVQAALRSGHVTYSRSVLRNMTAYCIMCHTRNDRGPDFPTFDLDPAGMSLPPMAKAEWLSATRRFDAALNTFESIVKDEKAAKEKPFEWGRAVQNAFTLSVRVKNDPDRTLKIMDSILSLKSLPGFYADNLPGWKKSIEQWKNEQGRKLNTEEGLFLEAVRLNGEAIALQKFPFDHSGDILYLRSSALIHEMLSKYPRGKRTGEALLLAGNAYDLLDDRLISPLPDLYYESCVRSVPHTSVSEQCYRRYEQNMLFGYSGSGGTFIPDDVAEVMKELRTLSSTK